MRRYIIIAIAILAAILVMSLVKLWQDRRARARGEEADTQLIGLPAVVCQSLHRGRGRGDPARA